MVIWQSGAARSEGQSSLRPLDSLGSQGGLALRGVRGRVAWRHWAA